MSKILIPTSGPEDWMRFLADPQKHWRTGYSARTLAHAWEAAKGLPAEIKAVFGPDSELLLAIPEHKTALPGGSTESQSDLFALVRAGENTLAATIEGKVNEAFGPTLGEWLTDASPGKRLRLAYICEVLGLTEPLDSTIRYQLLHRTASAVIESARFKTDAAAMVVHSFSATRLWFDDYTAFLALFGIAAEVDTRQTHTLPDGKPLHLAWVCGEEKFLES